MNELPLLMWPGMSYKLVNTRLEPTPLTLAAFSINVWLLNYNMSCCDSYANTVFVFQGPDPIPR